MRNKLLQKNFVITFLALLPGVYIDMASSASATTNQEDNEIRRVEVWLAEPVERIKGWTWGRRDDNDPLMMTAIQEPAYVVIHLPSGKVIESFTMGATMNNDDGFVSKVVLQPLSELAKSYDEVVDETEAVLERWMLKDDFRDGIAKWRGMYDQDPILISREDRKTNFKEYINVEIESDIWLSPERDIHFRGEGWYLQMNVYGGDAVDRKMGREVFKIPSSSSSAD